MQYRMSFSLISDFSISHQIIPDAVPLNNIEIDLYGLIDNCDHIKEIMWKYLQEDKLDYYILLKISDWLFECYKRISHPILSNRILNSFRMVISWANDRRDY